MRRDVHQERSEIEMTREDIVRMMKAFETSVQHQMRQMPLEGTSSSSVIITLLEDAIDAVRQELDEFVHVASMAIRHEEDEQGEPSGQGQSSQGPVYSIQERMMDEAVRNHEARIQEQSFPTETRGRQRASSSRAETRRRGRHRGPQKVKIGKKSEIGLSVPSTSYECRGACNQ